MREMVTWPLGVISGLLMAWGLLHVLWAGLQRPSEETPDCDHCPDGRLFRDMTREMDRQVQRQKVDHHWPEIPVGKN